ncbi:hypothetical protein [Streptomyces sp. NPDC060031]|uniref:hypothetical protein n=1 Tax=Streptomyces sp. NPDC060031 TaxID=3347043 RepID=UPI0036C956CB
MTAQNGRMAERLLPEVAGSFEPLLIYHEGDGDLVRRVVEGNQEVCDESERGGEEGQDDGQGVGDGAQAASHPRRTGPVLVHGFVEKVAESSFPEIQEQQRSVDPLEMRSCGDSPT